MVRLRHPPGGWKLKASDPARFHRGWPGFGFPHSFLYGAVVWLVFWKGFGSRTWGVSFMIGQWAHALTDAGDTVGTMLLFPWTHHFSVGAWAYAAQTGRHTDPYDLSWGGPHWVHAAHS